MSTSDQDVLIKILTAFDSGGIDAARNAAQSLKETLDDNSDSGKNLTGIMDVLNDSSGGAETALKGLLGVMKGGSGAASGLATAIKGIGSALGVAAGPIGLVATLVGVAVSAWQSYKQKQEEAAEATKKAAEDAKKAAEDFAKALDDVAKQSAAGVREEVKGIADELKGAADRAKELDDAMASIDDAQLGLELAELDAQLVGETDEGKRAELEQQKRRLRADHEKRKLQKDLADKQAEMDLMDSQEAAARKVTDEKSSDLNLSQARWGQESDAASAELSRAGLAAEEAENAYNAQRSKMKHDAAGNVLAGPLVGRINAAAQFKELKDLEKQRDEAKVRFEAAAIAQEETEQRIAQERTAAQAAYDEARQNESSIKSANDHRRQVLQANMDATKIKLQTADVTSQSSEKQYDIQRNDIIDKDTEKAAQAVAAAAEEARNKAVARDKAMSGEERIGRMQGLVAPMQKVGDQYYGGAAAGDTQQKAQTAIADAATRIQAGEEDQKVVDELVGTLQKLGAVIPNLGRLVTELDKMDGKIDGLQTQLDKLR